MLYVYTYSRVVGQEHMFQFDCGCSTDLFLGCNSNNNYYAFFSCIIQTRIFNLCNHTCLTLIRTYTHISTVLSRYAYFSRGLQLRISALFLTRTHFFQSVNTHSQSLNDFEQLLTFNAKVIYIIKFRFD